MSLINEMLRDLEARRAGDLARPDLQREIRPLPRRRRPGSGRTMLLAGLVLVAGMAVLAWWQADAWGPPAEAPPVPVAAPRIDAPARVPTAPQAETQQAVVTEALRLATALERLPAESAASPAPSVPAPPPAKAETAPPVPKVAEASSVSGSIEKTVVLGTPRERADAEYRRAQGLLAGGQPAAAQDALAAALRQDPSHVPARQALLRQLLESRRLDEAIASLREGLELQPAQLGWAMSLARLLVERGDPAGAESILARSASHASGNAEYAGFHGHLLVRAGQFRAAAERYQAACRLAPADGRWWFGLGQALEGDGHAAEAREAFRRALAAGNLNPELAALAEQRIH